MVEAQQHDLVDTLAACGFSRDQIAHMYQACPIAMTGKEPTTVMALLDQCADECGIFFWWDNDSKQVVMSGA